MKISADISSIISSERTVIVEHGEGSDRRSVTFGITMYKSNNFANDNEIFRAINEYWASLPEADQADIYGIYEEVRELFDSAAGTIMLKSELTALVTKLMKFHQTKNVIAWIKRFSDMKVPSKGKGEIFHVYRYDPDKDTTEDRTYIYEDYIGLMAISTILRVMIPIWSMYNKSAKDSSGKVTKEMQSFLLLQDSELYDSAPMQRLDRYIRANFKKESYTGNHTLEFICSDDMPVYLKSLVCVRKLCMGELYMEDPPQNLPALIYTFIMDRPGPQGNDHSQQVRVKEVKKGGEGEATENSGSTLEMYKARATVTSGRIAEMEYSLRDPYVIAERLAPQADRKLLRQDMEIAMDTSKELLEKGIRKPQHLLAPWITASVFPAQGVFYIEDRMITLCAITEVVLRHRGFGYLALLSTAVAMPEEDALRVAPMGSRAQVSKELSESLSHHFPYIREPKRKTASNGNVCLVTEDIQKLSMEFSKSIWRATADVSLVKQVLNTHVRRVPILPQLRSDLFAVLTQMQQN